MAQVEFPSFAIEWLDSGYEPECRPDPAYPDGCDVDATRGAAAWCKADLPYPARRCGLYLVACRRCGARIAITPAGRPDDPRSLKIACKHSGRPN